MPCQQHIKMLSVYKMTVINHRLDKLVRLHGAILASFKHVHTGLHTKRLIMHASIVMLLVWQTAVVCQQPSAFQPVQAAPKQQGINHNNQLLQQQPSGPNERFEAPVTALQTLGQGPGVDLVALNLRRFELNHSHPHRYRPNNPRVVMRDDFTADEDADLARGQQIEAHIAALPELILSRLPEETTHQLIESMSADPTLMGLTRQSLAGPSSPGLIAETPPQEDPDSASIERLTKSCLTVQASSLPADQLNVTFHLYTRRNPNNAFVMGPQISRDELLSRSPFKVGKPLKWVTHGFHTNLDKSEWMLDTKDKILQHEDANVILTDWRRGASPALAFYPKAAANAHVVAKMIVKILRRLLADINLGQVHLIGHSLGAHIMGFVGSAFTEEYLHHEQMQLNSGRKADSPMNEASSRTPGQPPSFAAPLIGRITACDPALPCFGSSSSGPNKGRRRQRHPAAANGQLLARSLAPQQLSSTSPMRSPDDWTPALWTHLRPDSAILVEVMHSNPGVMGYAEPLGDYDFFPNGSDRQPGCSGGSSTTTGETTANNQPEAEPTDHGDHSRARSLIETNEVMVSPRVASRLRGPFSIGPSYSSMGRSEFWPSLARAGDGMGSRLSKTLSQFIKPIRNFLQAYTCSHHRSVEYMVESLYYELVPLEHRLDRNLVCQLVGYRCPDYQSFKRGFCFTCRNELECRSFGLVGSTFGSSPNRPAETSPPTEMGYTPTLADQFAGVVQLTEPPPVRQQRSYSATNDDHWPLVDSEPSVEPGDQLETSNDDLLDDNHFQRPKRILPTLNQYRQDYKPVQRNQYYFDTKASSQKSYCLNHYHLLVKYRWFRIRESVTVDRFRLFGSLNDFTSFGPDGKPRTAFKFNKFSQHTYTMLLTSTEFLGRPEALLIYDSELKPQLVEYIDVTYLSNLDARVRSVSSARLCRADSTGQSPEMIAQLGHWLNLQPNPDRQFAKPINLFVRCPSANTFV